MRDEWMEGEGGGEDKVLTLCQGERHVHPVRGRPVWWGGEDDLCLRMMHSSTFLRTSLIPINHFPPALPPSRCPHPRDHLHIRGQMRAAHATGIN